MLAPLPDAVFEKARTLKVYGAPSEKAWSANGAQVTTDETVAIYGMDGNWVLVSYAIGNGSRGRIGYIDDMTVGKKTVIPQIKFCSIPIRLSKNADATDDPLRSQTTLITLKAGTEVNLMAFMGTEWAYVETTLKGQPCRLFIPNAALMQD